MAPVVASTAHAGAREQQAALRQDIPENAPTDFASLRQRADALAASQGGGFTLHEIGVRLASTTLRIEDIVFTYARGPATGWDMLTAHIEPPQRSRPGRLSGEISNGQVRHQRPRPAPVPAGILAPDEALRRLNRGPMAGSAEAFQKTRLPPAAGWHVDMQLIKIGAHSFAGSPAHRPHWTGYSGIDDPMFDETAPKGAWVWWTIVLNRTGRPGETYEYIYIDAVSGRATSYCAEPSGPRRLSRVSCAPATESVATPQPRGGRR